MSTLFQLYGLGWRAALPFLSRNLRLADGFGQRMLRGWPGDRVDVWIQGASAGESFMTVQLLSRLTADRSMRFLATTNTRQGLDILEGFVGQRPGRMPKPAVRVAYCPFDHPGIMDRAVRVAAPKVLVLLESEIWPGLLWAMKRRGKTVLIVNGRMTQQSFRRYRIWPDIWRSLAPDQVLAISADDADRFSQLFGPGRVSLMNNMKFDRIAVPEANGTDIAAIPKDAPYAVLGSVRQEEEKAVATVISRIFQGCPGAVIGLFPRHLERISHWQAALDRMEVRWRLRSKIQAPVGPGTIILWDVFGELFGAYKMASAAFVGGSLAPLGGQNILEPLMAGVLPTIGPSWENFTWIGQEVTAQGLLRVRPNADGVAETLLRDLANPPPRRVVQDKALAYVRRRQGGTDHACELIRNFLNYKKKDAR